MAIASRLVVPTPLCTTFRHLTRGAARDSVSTLELLLYNIFRSTWPHLAAGPVGVDSGLHRGAAADIKHLVTSWDITRKSGKGWRVTPDGHAISGSARTAIDIAAEWPRDVAEPFPRHPARYAAQDICVNLKGPPWARL